MEKTMQVEVLELLNKHKERIIQVEEIVRCFRIECEELEKNKTNYASSKMEALALVLISDFFDRKHKEHITRTVKSLVEDIISCEKNSLRFNWGNIVEML